MKKKSIIILVVAVLLIVLLFPLKLSYKDGGTIEYRAVLYGVTHVHRMTEKDPKQAGELYRKLSNERDTLSEEEIREMEEKIADNEGYEIGTVVRILFFHVYDDTHFVPSGGRER